MSMLKDESAQSGTILFLIFGVFMVGLIYVMLGPVMNENQEANNILINNSDLTYSDERADAMTMIYDTFKYFPVYILLLFVVWGVKKAIDKHSEQVI